MMARPFSCARRRFGVTCALALLALLAAGVPAAAAPRLPIVVHGGGGASNDLLYLDLESGQTFSVRLRRSGERFVVRQLEQNLFADIGRRQPATAGEFLLGQLRARNGRTRALLLAEPATGYLAFLDQLGEGGRFALIRTISGRPVDALAADDGNFALLMRRGTGGETDIAYLHHATTGSCLMLVGVDNLEGEPTVRECSELPTLAPGFAVAAVENGDHSTRGFLYADGAGAVYWLGLEESRADPLPPRRLGIDLLEIFPPPDGDSPAPSRRFALAPVEADGEGTTSVLVLDAASGRLARITGLAGETPRAALVPGDLSRYLPAAAGRTLGVAPRLSAFGESQGLWVFDGASERVILVDNPGSDEELQLVGVAVER